MIGFKNLNDTIMVDEAHQTLIHPTEMKKDMLTDSLQIEDCQRQCTCHPFIRIRNLNLP